MGLHLPTIKSTALLTGGIAAGGGSSYGISSSYSTQSERDIKAVYDLALDTKDKQHKDELKAKDDIINSKDKEIASKSQIIHSLKSDGNYMLQVIDHISKTKVSPFNCAYLSHWRNMYRDAKWAFRFDNQEKILEFQEWGCKPKTK